MVFRSGVDADWLGLNLALDEYYQELVQFDISAYRATVLSLSTELIMYQEDCASS